MRLDGTVVQVNDAYCALVALPRDEVVGHPVSLSGIVAEERVRWVYDRLPPAGRGYRYVRELPTPDGPRRFDVELHRIDIAGEEVVLAEVSPAAELSSPSDAGVLGMVLDRAPGVGIAVYDRDLRIVRVNTQVEQIGLITPAHIGMRIVDVVPDANPLVLEEIRRVFETGEARVNVEVTGALRDRSYLLTLFPISERAGEVEWVASIYSDVTERLRAEHALAESERHRREILANLLRSEEDERSRIATELHDDTVQVMTAALVAMDRVAIAARREGNERLAESTTRARKTLAEATDRTRRLMFELRPALLHERGLAPALRVLAEQTAREVGATARVRCPGARYDPAVESLVYRTVGEALANIRRHARPTRFAVAIAEADGRLTGGVRDDGCGFDIDEVRARPDAALHMGLGALTERIRAAGGDVSITSHPNGGTQVRFWLPVGGRRPQTAA